MTVGVLGSMVRDVIDHPAGERVERWGGIAYSLAAAAAAAPDGWIIRPIIRLGRDLAAEARAFLGGVPGLERPGGIVETAAPNNRVHLRYHDAENRHECLTGGVPPWTWAELEPLVDGLDGLFVNLVSGFELDLATAERLRSTFEGLLYADLHSLLLDVADHGPREPRRLEHRDRWLACFDIVQVNERELALVAGDLDPADLPAHALGLGVTTFLVTRGAAGARWAAAGDVPTGDAPVADGPRTGDPTGCGDVWGATCFIELMEGAPVVGAVAAANAAAARNVLHRGADGLYRHLRGPA